MPVIVKFQSTGTVPGDGRPVEMRGASLTIGRSAGNDLVLPDPDRIVSSRHCAIEDQNGNVVVVDFSTNGTFLNYGKVRLGEAPTPLNDGDILSIGSYELVVEISSAAAPGPDALPPLEEAPLMPQAGPARGGPLDGPQLRQAAGQGGADDAAGEWAALEPWCLEAESQTKDPRRGGRPKAPKPAKPKEDGFGIRHLDNGVTLRRHSDAKGYYIRFEGRHVDAELLERAMDELARLLGPA
ncbi:FHA domain-containing protein [Mangrovicoccus ximenensis]|uniref:FHA domain-containing protein n=1 Tax=Mangrovicoccus ximenensis TaxID=1911570 RepID=UPI000D3AAB58|nr:FHA domain-containing protein [Mangrovicoccus ximenensis]